jgi:phospholipase A-2-activating protein
LLADSGVFANTSPANNTMMAVRALSNLFKTEEGRAVANDEFDRLHEYVTPFLTSSIKNLIIAITTLYINYSVLLSSNSNADRALTLLDDLSKILNSATEPEAVYRALVATGTLLSLGDEYSEAGREVFQLGGAISRAENTVKEPRIKRVVAEIREKLQV